MHCQRSLVPIHFHFFSKHRGQKGLQGATENELDRPFLVKLCQKAKFGSFSPTISPFWELKVVLL